VTPEQMAARMRRELDQAPKKADRAVNRAQLQYEGDVKRDAPVDTGDYRRSINTASATTDPLAPTYVTGTNKPQGPTLEYGDTQPDRLGRARNFAPQPHFEPNLENRRKALTKEVKREFG